MIGVPARAIAFGFAWLAAGAWGCTPNVASTGSGGAGTTAAHTSSTGAPSTSALNSTSTTATTTNSAATGLATTTAASTGTGSTWGPCGGITDGFDNGDALWTIMGSGSISGGQAFEQGVTALQLAPTVPTDGCYIAIRVVNASFAPGGSVTLEADGGVIAYAKIDQSMGYGGIEGGGSSSVNTNGPVKGLALAFKNGSTWYLLSDANGWRAIGSTNAVVGNATVTVLSDGSNATKINLDDFGEPVPESALN